MSVITVGKCEYADDEEEKHETTEAAPQVVLGTCITPSIQKTQRYRVVLSHHTGPFILFYFNFCLAFIPSLAITGF